MTLYQYSEHWWNEICKTLKQAHLFIDDQSVESLHWNGGWPRLKEAGAVCVSEFSPTNFGLVHEKKGVFVICGPLINGKREILREIIEASHFEYCQVISSAFPCTINWAKFGHRNEADNWKAKEELEKECLLWMGNPNFTCEFLHIPFHTVAVTRDLFILPSFSDVFPILTTEFDETLSSSTDFPASKSSEGIFEWSLDHIPFHSRVNVLEFVQAFDSLLQTLDIKEDIFTMGKLSKLIGVQLESFSKGKTRRKNSHQRASVIFVDRTLDMATACDCHFQVAFDEIRSSLPQLPGHELDVKINMGPSCSEFDSFAGSLGNVKWDNEGHDQTLDDLITEDLVTCQKRTVQALKSVLKINQVSATFDEEDLLKNFGRECDKIEKHLLLIQKAQAIANTKCETVKKRFDKIRDIQTELMKNMSSRQELLDCLPFITKLIRHRHSSEISLDEILLLITYIYAMLPSDVNFFEEDEDRLQSALSAALISERENLGEIFGTIMAGQEVHEVLAYQAIKNIFVKLKALSKEKDFLSHWRSINLESGARDLEHSQHIHSSFLEQLTEVLFSEDRRDIPDLQHISGGFGGILKSGISLLGMNLNKMHPRENPTIIIFVIGGVMASEVNLIRGKTSAKSKAKILIGSTKMAGPWDSLRSLFIEKRCKP